MWRVGKGVILKELELAPEGFVTNEAYPFSFAMPVFASTKPLLFYRLASLCLALYPGVVSMLGFRNSCIQGFTYAGLQMQGLANAGLCLVGLTSAVLLIGHYRFKALILFGSIQPSLAAELSCSCSHDFRHGGLHSHMAGECSPLRGPRGPAGKKQSLPTWEFHELITGADQIRQEDTVVWQQSCCWPQPQARFS